GCPFGGVRGGALGIERRAGERPHATNARDPIELPGHGRGLRAQRRDLLAGKGPAQHRLCFAETPLPLAAYGDPTTVVTVGSMSKLFWSGFRVGWVRPFDLCCPARSTPPSETRSRRPARGGSNSAGRCLPCGVSRERQDPIVRRELPLERALIRLLPRGIR